MVWSIGLLMPVWLFVSNFINKWLSGTELPGAWLYVSVILGAVICGIVISFSALAVWRRVSLVLISWILIAGEVLALGAFELSRSGLAGTH